MIFVLCAKSTVNNSQRATIDVCGIGLYPFRQFIPEKGLDSSKLREFIEILQRLILSSFAEQSIKKIIAKQNAH
jgi:hypothetical protein